MPCHRHSRCKPLKIRKLRAVSAVFKGDNPIVQDELFDCQINNLKAPFSGLFFIGGFKYGLDSNRLRLIADSHVVYDFSKGKNSDRQLPQGNWRGLDGFYNSCGCRCAVYTGFNCVSLKPQVQG